MHLQDKKCPKSAPHEHNIDGNFFLTILGTLSALALFQFSYLSYAQADGATKKLKINPSQSQIYFIAQAGIQVGTTTVSKEVRGDFEKFDGQITLNDGDFSRSTVQMNVDTASVNTQIAQRDEHLRNPDFFDVGNWPQATFRTISVTQKSRDSFDLKGRLMIRGVAQTVTFAFKVVEHEVDAQGKTHLLVKADTTVNRQDFGLNFSGDVPTEDLSAEKMGLLERAAYSLNSSISALKNSSVLDPVKIVVELELNEE